MLRSNLVPIFVIVLIGAALVLTAFSITTTPGSVTTALPTEFVVNGKVVPITNTAVTQSEREHGLMNTKVTNTTVMLFAWPSPGLYQFWMLDTNTSLDMIWVNGTSGTGTVVYVVNAAPSCYSPTACTVYTPASPANYVLEAKAGFAMENGIVAGTILRFG